MARIEVPMPQMGESIAEGTVSVWLKKVGDRVERDEPIMEISTDKVDAEIPAPVAGVLAGGGGRGGRGGGARPRAAHPAPLGSPAAPPPRPPRGGGGGGVGGGGGRRGGGGARGPLLS